MSRSVKGVREVLQHSKSGQQIPNDDEKYNFVKDKSQSSQKNVSELIAKIESLEYDIVMLTDNLTAVQRNYDNVSRLLRQEREKDNNRDKMTSKRNDELEMMVNIESTRARVVVG
jgi:molecular chaperone GrpE (heat shock protein)